LACAAGGVLWVTETNRRANTTLTYSEFLNRVENGQVAGVVVNSGKSAVVEATWRLADGAAARTVLPADYRDALRIMQEKRVNVEIRESSSVGPLLLNASPFLSRPACSCAGHFRDQLVAASLKRQKDADGQTTLPDPECSRYGAREASAGRVSSSFACRWHVQSQFVREVHQERQAACVLLVRRTVRIQNHGHSLAVWSDVIGVVFSKIKVGLVGPDRRLTWQKRVADDPVFCGHDFARRGTRHVEQFASIPRPYRVSATSG
jgi:hypothetical protein